MSTPCDDRKKLDRVTAEQVARILAGGSAALFRSKAAPKRAPVIERETMEALPAGHPVSWAALWRGAVPDFPGLQPMGALEPVTGCGI